MLPRSARFLQNMVGPAAKLDAVTHLKAVVGLSKRRACPIISADRKMICYRSSLPPEVELQLRLRDLANERRQTAAIASAGLRGHCFVGVEINLFVFDRVNLEKAAGL